MNTPNDEARSRAKSVVLDLEQALPALRRASRNLAPERSAAIVGPVEAEIERQRRDAPQGE